MVVFSGIEKTVCGAHAVYNDCGTACPITCKNYLNPPKVCTRDCKPGCECKPGFILDVDGKCVTRNRCSAGKSFL